MCIQDRAQHPPVAFNTFYVCERSQSLRGATNKTVMDWDKSAASNSTFPTSPAQLKKPV